MSPKGALYSEETIQTSLDMRYLSVKARNQGIYGEGLKAYSKEDQNQFVQTLTKKMSNNEGILL